MPAKISSFTVPKVEKTQLYQCTACGAEFYGVPGIPPEWPERGHGLPPFCADNDDCRLYLEDLSILREWMNDHGTPEHVGTDGNTRYTLHGHNALHQRITQRRTMVEADQRGRW